MSFFGLFKKKEKSSLEKKVVLIISNDKEKNDVYVEEIQKHGAYSVIAALTGKDGIRMARRSKPDIIFLDWDIDKPSGPEVIFQIKRIKRTKDIPLCMLLRGNRIVDYELVRSANIKDYIMKPCTVEQIIDLIRVRTAA